MKIKTKFLLFLILFILSIFLLIYLCNITYTLFLNKIYMKFQKKLLYVLPMFLMFSFVILIFSHYLIDNLVVKFSIMCFGYSIISTRFDTLLIPEKTNPFFSKISLYELLNSYLCR